MMRIILCGFGVVGKSLAQLLNSRSDDLYSEHGFRPRIVGVFDSKGAAASESGLDLEKLVDVKESEGTVGAYGGKVKGGTEMIRTLGADVLVETTASNYVDAEPGMTHITEAMKRNMHVVSVNKGPLALALPSLTELAEFNSVLLRFSGTVGGGTPILDYAKNSLNGEKITKFKGILNGTTNYILTNMNEGQQFKESLDDARKKGYVEQDESLDLDGFDAAAKLTILANWIMGKRVVLSDIQRTGIRDVTADDVKRAAESGNSIKLIASCNGDLQVKAVEISKKDPLCVDGTLNAVSFTSEHAGTQTIIGKGAGGTETASAILRDLLEISERLKN